MPLDYDIHKRQSVLNMTSLELDFYLCFKNDFEDIDDSNRFHVLDLTMQAHQCYDNLEDVPSLFIMIEFLRHNKKIETKNKHDAIVHLDYSHDIDTLVEAIRKPDFIQTRLWRLVQNSSLYNEDFQKKFFKAIYNDAGFNSAYSYFKFRDKDTQNFIYEEQEKIFNKLLEKNNLK